MPKPPTQTDLVIDLLFARKGEWVPMPDLASHMGGYAVHSRVADLRERGHNISNRIEIGKDKKKLSFYKLR